LTQVGGVTEIGYVGYVRAELPHPRGVTEAAMELVAFVGVDDFQGDFVDYSELASICLV
jgi:hypothetical protein